MQSDANHAKPRNLLLVALFIIITLFTAFHEGYIKLISIFFWISLVIGFSISIWLAFSVSTKRLLSLILGIFIIEYIKETIGMRSGMWTYHGVDGLFNFGVWAWVLGGLTVYTLATRVVIKLIKKLNISLPKWYNISIIVFISLLVPLTLGNYWSGAGGLFFLFYTLLAIVGIFSSMRMDFHVLAGIVITSWIVSNPSEYVGSVASGVWTFTHNHDYPPFFLLLGCWPLEILAQYVLSAILANEPLN